MTFGRFGNALRMIMFKIRNIISIVAHAKLRKGLITADFLADTGPFCSAAVLMSAKITQVAGCRLNDRGKIAVFRVKKALIQDVQRIVTTWFHMESNAVMQKIFLDVERAQSSPIRDIEFRIPISERGQTGESFTAA